jgi:hypothetical protein
MVLTLSIGRSVMTLGVITSRAHSTLPSTQGCEPCDNPPGMCPPERSWTVAGTRERSPVYINAQDEGTGPDETAEGGQGSSPRWAAVSA